jgi:hypothetical protein
MSVKSFKFVSPGVFINEIDNSFIPRSAEAIGPVIIGRSTRGPGGQPAKVESYSDFVNLFGDTVPGGSGGDISRYGNFQSPMYGTYAAKAFLVSNVAPLTYVRVLGEQHPNNDASSAGQAGWKTVDNPTVTPATAPNIGNGGAYGLFVFTSASAGGDNANIGTGSLAAVWYLNNDSTMVLSGTMWGGPHGAPGALTGGIGHVISTDPNSGNSFKVRIQSSTSSYDKTIAFNLDDTSEGFIRKAFNTNPQLVNTPGDFYPNDAFRPYWLGETYEQEIRDAGVSTGASLGVLLPLAVSGTAGPIDASVGPHNKKVVHQEARTGWFIGQDLTGDKDAFIASELPKLFKLKGLGHGSWLNENVKVSIEKIRTSNTTTTDYGTFSIVLRNSMDTDNKRQVLERFDNLNLDPTSPNFISRRIGDQYQKWVEAERRLKTYGEYQNQSKYIYVIVDGSLENGDANPLLLPFGYQGPPQFKDKSIGTDAGIVGATTFQNNTNGMGYWIPGLYGAHKEAMLAYRAATLGSALDISGAIGGLSFPSARLRVSASDGGIANQKDAYFGFQNTRAANSTKADHSIMDVHKILTADMLDTVDLTLSGNINGVKMSYIFTMNDIRSVNGGYHYESGSYKDGIAMSIKDGATYKTQLQAGIDRFNAPLFGGFDGFDITKPDPLYNKGIGTSERNSYVHYSIKRAIDTVADPEFIDMNLLTVPGITTDALTNHAIDVCEDRGDAMALIDLPDVYTPLHEQYDGGDKSARITSSPNSSATNLKDRQIDSSYGATFYPWVQTRDANSGRALWVPPTVAMMGVLASSQAVSHLWFAPAGFNRGGLSDGAAGIPITSVTERLTAKERDVLYEANINPIASFPSSGIVVFGQKTLQERQSALDRINVRRLVIYLKKQISVLSTQVLFEQNVQSTWNRFRSLVEPFLANVKVQFGITDYRLILDESTTTPDLIDQNIMYAKIMVKPARAIEYIAIDFVIASTGASFDD